MNILKKHIMRTVLAALLLLVGGMTNYVTAGKVTYHILTKPFNVRTWDNSGDFKSNIRVEALQCTSEEATVGLPDQFKSPLATNFKYWGSATYTYANLYDNHTGTKIINAKYYIYQCEAGNQYACLNNEIPSGTSSDDYTDIYVTYDYIGDNDIVKLDGATDYNIAITSKGTEKFLSYNRSRNNRVANAKGAALSGEHLASDDFVIPEEGTGTNQLGWKWSKWGPIGLFLGFNLDGQDPYNVTIMTSYEGGEIHITDKTSADSKATIKPYKGSSLFSQLGASAMWFDASNNRHYLLEAGSGTASDYTPANYAKYKKIWENASSDAERYEIWMGFYRGETPTLNSYAILNNPNGGYMFVASKANQGTGGTAPTIKQPNSNKYYTYNDNSDNDGGGRSQPYFQLLTLNSALSTNFYEIRTYRVNIKTHGSASTLYTDMKWSDARLSDNPAEHVPDALKRKYVTYSAYKDEALTQPMTTFAEAAANSYVIWLDYTVSESLPFDTLAATSGTYDYRNARWYTMRMDGVTNPKYIAYDDDSNNLVVTNGSGAANGSNTASQIHQGENSPEAMVAFIGDPYELKILNRKACEDAADNRFIGCATASTLETTGLTTNQTGSSDISKWEIVYESTGETGMLLRKFKTANEREGEEEQPTPKYIGLGSAANNKPVIYSATASRIRVVELQKVDYVYHIMRNDAGDIAVKATVSQDVGTALRTWKDIPEIIRSPYLETATVTYYDDVDKAKAKTPTISNAPYSLSGGKIYVRYSYTSAPASSTYNVRVNNNYIYTDTEGTAIKTKTQLEEGDASDGHFVWTFDFSDPYALTINNTGIDGDAKYVTVSQSDGASITWSETPTLFIAKSGALSKTYEVMLATGDDIDASTEYYNIGRPSENTVKLYSNSSYLSGNQTLRFQFSATTAVDVTYHLIDISGTDLLQSKTRQALTDNPAFPPEYYSPLVSKYYYHKTIEHARANRTSGDIADDAQILQDAVYVTYDVNNLVNLQRGQLYLLKYEAGENFRQEDGGDNLLPQVADMSENTYRYKAVYPYCNGDGNFFVYGQEQYDIQQQGAASTRTRWAWYVQSDLGEKGDPYHVKIRSRQQESYPIENSKDYNSFFATFKPDGYDKAVTTLVWPGISGETATDYMVLGSEGQYQLMTSYKVDMNNDGDTDDPEDERKVVNTFEQYWKTYDTVKNKLLTSILDDEDKGAKLSVSITVPDKAKYRDLLTGTGDGQYGFHNYEHWAYAKRFNGYNNGYSSKEGTPETKKGWEEIEHWYQTIDMGEGYFDFVKTSIDPVLILLDQHGWEIMRKPLPSSPEDPDKEAKYEAIRPYNSPMVKEYAFWATAKKRSGFHQYYLLSDRMDDDYTTTDLTSLPAFNGKNVHDKKGNLNDQYVTYIVKDEYAQTYNPADKTSKPFVIEQGTKYASTSDGSTIIKNDVPANGMLDYITNNSITDDKKWYIKPNWNIDYEMGYAEAAHTWTKKKEDGNWDNKNPNAYEHKKYKDAVMAQYISDKDSLGYFSFSNGFDPYNIQIMPINYSTDTRKFMKTNATGMNLDDGIMHGVYETDPAISLGDSIPVVDKNNSVWFDSRKLSITNTTFMAVQDAAGNMQLMPRFDQDLRMSEFGTLIEPTDAGVASTYTTLYRPEVYEYRIIDNSGHESLRYKSGGDMLPQTPDHFKSPLAMNFTYYASATLDDGIYTVDNEIEGSLDGASLTDDIVYVRYEYDEEADNLGILKGNWLTMQMYANSNWKYVQYGNTASSFATEGMYPDDNSDSTKPATVDGDDKIWQWKFLETPQSDPDPYAVQIFNRDKQGLPMSSSSNNGKLTANSSNTYKYFALLSHSSGDYAMVLARTNSYSSYYFLHGGSTMQYTNEKTAKLDAGTTPTMEDADQIKLFDEVQHTFTYKVYTNEGVNAVDATQTQDEVTNNSWKPTLPEAAQTPLLNIDQYRYYEQSLAGTIAENDTLNKSLPFLYGLYDDVVYTHYTPYSDAESTYLVPNVRNATNVDPVARGVGSNDAPIGIDGTRPYNIIWYQDNMMKSNGTAIASDADKSLQAVAAYEWSFEGDDPYAIKIKNSNTGTYVHENTTTATDLNAEATSFMLLGKDNYDYGVFAKTGTAKTGATPVMLSGHGDVLTTSDPTKFIIFALSTYKVIYHLMIKNIGQDVIIPYRETKNDAVQPTKIKAGTTTRDLKTKNSGANGIDGDWYQLGSTLKGIDGISHALGVGARDSIYCYDAGHVSLGAAFTVPTVFYRPNVTYDFYIEGVYSEDGTTEIADMNAEYKGLQMANMGENSKLLGKVVLVNIVYNFMGGLDTNSGSDFVESVSQNKWYTFETSGLTPKLAQYTGSLQTVSGYATHFTNDYLWTPVGDPYGFKMYNRYLHKNLGQSKVMSTSEISGSRAIEMETDNGTNIYSPANSVYELLSNSSTTPGYFRIHPVVNNSGAQYYMYDNNGTIELRTTPTEWTFGLSEDVMSPYYTAAGYVGGLNAAGKAAYDTEAAKTNPLERLMGIQNVVYNHDNDDSDPENPNYIVHYAPGYYRLHSQYGSSGISTPRYASGYKHAIELDPNGDSDEADAIPMHFYEQTEYNIDEPVFGDLGVAGTDFTETNATRGEVPITTVDEDPASIFQFTGTATAAKMSTQGLYVVGSKRTATEGDAKMTATEGSATSFNIVDIGGAIVALSNGTDYLCYNQTGKKYDLKYGNYSEKESARWCMQPVQKGTTAGLGEMGLRVRTHDDGNAIRYATFYAPFDVLLTNASTDMAYIVPTGEMPALTADTQYTIRPKKMGDEGVNTGTYAGNNLFIPAGTAAIIRTKATSGYVTLALPTATPSSSVSCVFTGQYLEQMLTHGSDYVFVFGRPSSGTFTEDASFSTNGLITVSAPASDRGVGFYKNANLNRESSKDAAAWTRNNKYVYGNKIYYRAAVSSGGGGSALDLAFEESDYIPVIFDEDELELQEDGNGYGATFGDGRIYDLQGRCIATKQEVLDGSWINTVAPGIYILNGKKIAVK